MAKKRGLKSRIEKDDGTILVTPGEFGRILQRPRSSIIYQIENGHLNDIVEIVDGRRFLDLERGKKIYGEVYSQEHADKAKKSPMREYAEKKKLTKKQKVMEQVHEEVQAETFDGIPDMTVSRRRAEHFKSKKAELEFNETLGRLVDAEKVKKDAFEMAKRVRDSLMNIPSKIAPQLASMTDPLLVEQLVERELRTSLEELSRGTETK